MTAGIVLAAGLSKRMGTPKLLLEFNGAPVIHSVLKAALESDLDEVILVTGPADDMAGVFAHHPKLNMIMNSRPASGMASSVVTGLGMVSSAHSGAMIILGDQPFVRKDIINTLVAVFCADRTRIVIPTINGRNTTPVVFPSSLFPDLLRISGDIGGREIIEKNTHLLVRVDLTGSYDDDDLDSPDDFARIKAKMENTLRTGLGS